jgi:hypothetical protein
MRNKVKNLPLTMTFFAVFTIQGIAQTPRPVPKLSLKFILVPAAHKAPKKNSSKSETDSLYFAVQVALPSGWHINSDAPPDSFLVATTVQVAAQGMAFLSPQFPKPERVFSPAMGDTLPLFSGVFEVHVPAHWLPGLKAPNTPNTRVTLHYQACNDSMCLPPKDVTAELAAGIAERF